MQDSPFYHGSIRKIAAAFGTIFDKIKIEKDLQGGGSKTINVPLRWGPKSHYYTALRRKTQTDSKTISVDLPQISYYLSGMGFNSGLATNPLNRFSLTDSATQKRSLYNPAPYLFNFELIIFSNNMLDSYKILEQILPHFRPNINLTVKTLDSMDIEENVNITLESVTPDDNWQDQAETNRIITWTLSFNVDGHIYPAIRDTKIITDVTVDLENWELDPPRIMETINVDENENVTITENNE